MIDLLLGLRVQPEKVIYTGGAGGEKQAQCVQLDHSEDGPHGRDEKMGVAVEYQLASNERESLLFHASNLAANKPQGTNEFQQKRLLK